MLFVVDGPLKDFECQLLGQLTDMEKPVLVCLNKEDWFAADDRQRLLEQIRQQVPPQVRPEDVISIRAQPGAPCPPESWPGPPQQRSPVRR